MAPTYRVAPKESWKKLGLNSHHDSIVAWAHWSLSQVESGQFLVPPSRTKAGERLVELGYLEEVDRLSAERWLVVKLTQPCWDKLRADLSSQVPGS